MPTSQYECPSFILSSRSLQSFRDHAIAHPSREVFGLLTYIPGDKVSLMMEIHDNVAINSTDRFMASSAALRRAHDAKKKGRSLIICHSHLKQHLQHFSPNDIHTIHQWSAAGLLLHGKEFEKVTYYDSTGSDPLEGRPWRPTESNCYTLVRDALTQRGFNLDAAFRREAIRAGISFDSIFDLMRRTNQVEVYSLAPQVLKAVGDRSTWFKPGVIKQGDVLMFAPSHEWPTHLGIMGDLAKNEFLHHRAYKQSGWSQFDEQWRESLCGVFRIPSSPVYHRPSLRLAS